MREIQASEAKAKFSALLDAVERGETIAITRHGKVIARLNPEVDERHKNVAETIEKLKAFRKTMPKVTTEEILQWRHEGHKY